MDHAGHGSMDMSAMQGAEDTGMGMMMDMDHGGMMMQMYFTFTQKATILFKGWEVDSAGGIIGSMFAVFFMALLFEAFKALRDRMTARMKTQSKKPGKRNEWRDILIQTLLQMLQLTWAYFLMLIFMTYNAWLCIAVILGDGVGYLIFFNSRPLAMSTQEDDCCGS